MKKRTICKENKTNDSFYKCKKCKDGLQTLCKDCGRTAAKKHTQNNSKKFFEYTKERKRVFFIKYEEYKKKLSCNKCGDTRHYVLEFHHIDQDKKTGTISRIKQNCNWEQLMAEISICEVLCANCHREYHYNNKDTYSHKR